MYRELFDYKIYHNGSIDIPELPEDMVLGSPGLKQLERLRKWRDAQARSLRRWSQGHTDGDLTADRVMKLRVLGLHAPSYDQMYSMLATHKAKTGSLDVKEDGDDRDLFSWVKEQRAMLDQHFRGLSVALSEDQIQDLLSLGFQKNDASDLEKKVWDEMYRKLVAYKDCHNGSIDIPDLPEDGVLGGVGLAQLEQLREWRDVQAEGLRSWSQGYNHVELTADMVAKLRDVGLCALSYDQMFSKLAAHKAKTGSLDVNRDDDRDLFEWAEAQRAMLARRHFKRLPVALSNNQIQNLLSLGFEKNSVSGRKKKAWDTMYQLLIEYKNKHDGSIEIALVPDGEMDEQSLKQTGALRRWCNAQVRHHRRWCQGHADAGELTGERVEKLREAGFHMPSYNQLYGKLAAYKAETGSLEVDKEEDEELFRWTEEQRKMLARHRKGKDVPLTEDQIQNLAVLGFEESQNKNSQECEWNKMCDRMVDYKNANDGSIHIPEELVTNDSVEAKKLNKLRCWRNTQTQYLRRWSRGLANRRLNLTDEKIDRLREAGLHVPSYDEMFQKLMNHKAETGTLDVNKEEDEELFEWAEEQKKMLAQHFQGKPVSISDGQIQQLKSLGYEKTGRMRNRGGPSSVGDMEARWNTMLEALVKYREEHGHFKFPTDKSVLPKHERMVSYWVKEQRLEYTKLQDGKESSLTAQQLQRLTAIGFDMSPRPRQISWEDRMQSLRDFVLEHGHCRPNSETPLGKFVIKMRQCYRLRFEEGQKNSLTDERINDLLELGFEFKVGKSPNFTAEKKSWEERFEDLLAFAEEHGHTRVPQLSGPLGRWVHAQRVQYKKMKEGRKSAMTAEKALKLTQIGFEFDGNRKRRLD